MVGETDARLFVFAAVLYRRANKELIGEEENERRGERLNGGGKKERKRESK